jgi:hypothetical protein
MSFLVSAGRIFSKFLSLTSCFSLDFTLIDELVALLHENKSSRDRDASSEIPDTSTARRS